MGIIGNSEILADGMIAAAAFYCQWILKREGYVHSAAERIWEAVF